MFTSGTFVMKWIVVDFRKVCYKRELPIQHAASDAFMRTTEFAFSISGKVSILSNLRHQLHSSI